ncbi:MAG: C10 family peptidase [Bacteroidales bacterium]|nr:C10 family peptidase [Bacteroidales bacterium]
MKKSIVTFFFILTASIVWSNPIDSTTAKKVATNFYKQNNVVGIKNGIPLKITKTNKDFYNVSASTDFNHFYIFNSTDGNGFVIVSADDRATPILGYANVGTFPTDNIAPQIINWLEDYDKEIEYLISNNIQASDEISEEWQNLRNGSQLQPRDTRSVSPLIQTFWDQSPLYNYLCPYDEANGEYTLTGCIATAMAQVMKYWEYPNMGTGTHTYYDLHYGIQNANFETTLLWNEMPNSLNSSSSIMQINAVATLMRLCGVSVDMHYGIAGSSSNVQLEAEGLKNHFNYSQNLNILTKDDYSSSQWISILKAELDAGRPILYGGTDSQTNSGHAFICDGYDNNNLFHFNWGYSGIYDGYFYVSNLNPGVIHNYSTHQKCIVGVEPAEPVTHPNYDLVMTSNLTTNASTYNFGDNIVISKSIKNCGSANFSGWIIVMVADFDGNVIAQKHNYATIPINQTNTTSVLFNGGMPLVPGDYMVTVFTITDTNDLNTLRFVRDNSQNQNLAQFSITYSSDIETNSDFSFSTGEMLYSNRPATINVDILNTSNSTFTGNVGVAILDLNGNIQQIVAQQTITNGLQPYYHYTTGLNFTGNISVSAGEYFLMLLYQYPNETEWICAGSSEYRNPIRFVVTNPPTPDIYEQNNTISTAYTLTPNFANDSCVISTSGSSIHIPTDIDFYRLTFPAGYNYEIYTFLVDRDICEQRYPMDCFFSIYPSSTNVWSEICDGGNGPTAFLSNGGTIYFKVSPYSEDEILGEYLLRIEIVRHILPDQYEPNNTVNSSHNIATVNTNSKTINVNANFHINTDNDYYKINLPSGYSYTINANILNSYNDSNYTADAKFATSLNGNSWSNNYGNSMPALTVSDGGTLYLRVLPYTSNEIGTYSLHITISRQGGIEADIYEPNNSPSTAYILDTINGSNTTINADANFHITSDEDYYKLIMLPGFSYTVNATLYDSYNDNTHTADAKFAVSPDGYYWSEFYGVYVPTTTYDNGGRIYFRVIPYQSGGTGTYRLNVIITASTAVKEHEKLSIHLYPNPTSDYLHITAPANLSINHLELLTIKGQLIKIFNDNITSINVSDLSSGIYVIRIYTEDEIFISKFIKK